MRLRFLFLAVSVAASALGADMSLAASTSDAGSPATKATHHKHVAKAAAAKAKPAEPVPVAPWAAVDPARAGVAGPTETAATPGVHHVVQPDQDRMSYGMKWTSSNTNANQYSTQGVLNEINHDLGAPNAIGTDAEMGVKLHF